MNWRTAPARVAVLTLTVCCAATLSSTVAVGRDVYPRFDPTVPLYEISGAPPAPLHIVLQTVGEAQDPTLAYGTDPAVPMTFAGTDFGGVDESAADYLPSAPAEGCETVPITATWHVAAPAGPHVAPAVVEQTVGSVTVLCPTLTVLSTGPQPAGTDSVQVLPHDFDVPGAQAGTLSVDGAVVPGVAQSTTYQAASIAVPLPHSCGTHTITIEQTIAAGLLQASASVDVRCPVAMATPQDVVRAPDAQVTVTGTGFPADDGSVGVDLDGTPVTTSAVAADGSAVARLPVGAVPCGGHTVVLASMSKDWVRASADFVVNCPSARGPLRVTVSPGVAARGSPLLIVVDDVPAGAVLSLTWSLPDGRQAPVTGTARAVRDGTAVALYSWVSDDLTGPRTLEASDGSDRASAPLMVPDATMQPAGNGRMAGRR